jgi:hypothetical protein
MFVLVHYLAFYYHSVFAISFSLSQSDHIKWVSLYFYLLFFYYFFLETNFALNILLGLSLNERIDHQILKFFSAKTCKESQ